MSSILRTTALLAVSVLASPGADAPAFPVAIQVDVTKPLGPLKPIWRYFGADEPNYATMKDGKKLLGELGEMAPKQVQAPLRKIRPRRSGDLVVAALERT